MPLFFNAQVLPNPANEYVAWIDVMGVQSAMSRSLNITANFIFKLHVAALQAPHAGLSLYPVEEESWRASPATVKNVLNCAIVCRTAQVSSCKALDHNAQ
jgi:hypothetical protein